MQLQDGKLPITTRLLTALNKYRDDPDKLKDLLKAICGDVAATTLETQIAELQKCTEADQEKNPTQLSDRTWEILDQIVHSQPAPPKPRPWQTIDDDLPAHILTGAELDGPLLAVGMVGILAGAGGAGKSRLAAQIALQIAANRPDPCFPTADGLWHVEQGPVLYATYEDPPAITTDRLKALAAYFQYSDPPPVHVLDLQGWPLFGAQNYQERPSRLEGFKHLAQAVETTQPRLIIIDPALCAYVADSNNAAPVREFVTALATLAAEHAATVLLVAHSTKAARSTKNETPDPFDAGQIGRLPPHGTTRPGPPWC